MYFVVYIYISKFTDIISYYVATNARSMYVHDILIKCFDKRWNSFASHCIHHTHHTHHTRTQDTVAKVVVGGTEWCMAMGSVASPRNVGVAPSSRPALLACLLHIVLHAAPLGPPLTLPPYTAFFLLLLVPVTSLLSSLSLCSSTQLSYHFVCLSYAAARRVTFRSQLPPPRKCISIGRGNAGCNGTPLSFFPFVRPTFHNYFSRRLGFFEFWIFFLLSKIGGIKIKIVNYV